MDGKADEIRKLQKFLQLYDNSLKVDGLFGPRTERALRLAQRRNSIFPADGQATEATLSQVYTQGADRNVSKPVVGSRTAGSRSHDLIPIAHIIDPAQRRAAKSVSEIGSATSVAAMSTSGLGKLFIIREECQKGVSNRIHHPSAGSGVTIGPGYDMKNRSSSEIVSDLMSIGVDAASAAQAAKGAQKDGEDADAFVLENKSILNLSEEQEAGLLTHIIGHYEKRVKNSIKVPLYQFEFDALVSFAYNPGGGWHSVISLVNRKKYPDAMRVMLKQVYSKKKLMKGLQHRRAKEIQLFAYGEYK